MTRIVKEYAVRRDEILDSAQRLIYSKGYEQMTIQDILDDLQIAKGTFYHYFDSKQALLEATIARLLDATEALIAPILADTTLSALDKFERFMTTVGGWKNERRPFLLALLRIWYTDDNAVVREKMRQPSFERLAPFYNGIIEQGIHEGVFDVRYPEQAGRIVLALMAGLEETTAEILLALDQHDGAAQTLANTYAAYTDAIERVLGARTGSLRITDAATLREWVAALYEEGTKETTS